MVEDLNDLPGDYSVSLNTEISQLVASSWNPLNYLSLYMHLFSSMTSHNLHNDELGR
jgi:hypothetical protein